MPIRLKCELLEGREVPAVFTLPGIYSAQAIEVDPLGTVRGVGVTLDQAQLRVGEYFTVTPDGAYSQQRLGGGDFDVSSVIPTNIRNGRAVGVASVFTANTSIRTERALGWNLSNPGTAYELGHAVAPGYEPYQDYTRAVSLNASGRWAGSSGAGILSVTGQLFDASTFTIIPTPLGSATSATDIADDGTMILTVVPYPEDRIEAWVVKPDGRVIELRNPFAPDPVGHSEMFGWRISEDGSKILCNASTFNPDRETTDFVPVVFSGPDFSVATVVPDARGGPYFGFAEDVENSGLVSIQSSEGIALWRPGMTAPISINNLAAPTDALPQYPFFGRNNNAAHPQNPVEENNGKTYVAFQILTNSVAGSESYLLRLDGIVGNQAPTVPNQTLATDEDRSLALNLLAGATDADGDVPLVTAVTQPAHGTVTWAADGTATYRPAADSNGPDAFTYTVTDGKVSVVGSVSITVRPVNDRPIAVADVARTTRGQAVTLDALANDTDVDGDRLSVVTTTVPTNGRVALLPTGQLSYTPRAGFVGTDQFSYTVSDGHGGTATATVTVTVTQPNRNPVARPDVLFFRGWAGQTFDPSRNDTDPDGDSLAVTGVGTPRSGRVSLSPDGLLIYTPRPSFVGVDYFTYTLADGRGGTATGVVVVVVLPGSPSTPLVARTTTPSLSPFAAYASFDVASWLEDIITVPGRQKRLRP